MEEGLRNGDFARSCGLPGAGVVKPDVAKREPPLGPSCEDQRDSKHACNPHASRFNVCRGNGTTPQYAEEQKYAKTKKYNDDRCARSHLEGLSQLAFQAGICLTEFMALCAQLSNFKMLPVGSEKACNVFCEKETHRFLDGAHDLLEHGFDR